MSIQELSDCRRPDGLLVPGDLAAALGATKAELAAAVGLPRDALTRTSRLASRRTQQRLGELVEIIETVMPWTGHPRIAYAWYRSQGLPSFGGETPEDLLKAGRYGDVESYLARISEGGYT